MCRIGVAVHQIERQIPIYHLAIRAFASCESKQQAYAHSSRELCVPGVCHDRPVSSAAVERSMKPLSERPVCFVS